MATLISAKLGSSSAFYSLMIQAKPGMIYWILTNHRMGFRRNNNNITFCCGIMASTHRLFLVKSFQTLTKTPKYSGRFTLI